MISEELKKVINYYGDLNLKSNYYLQCNIKKYGSEPYLNKYYKKINYANYEEIENKLNIKLPSDLAELYKEFNGINLFSDSFVIFGRQLYEDDLYNEDDIAVNNIRLCRYFNNAEMSKMFHFGYAGPTLLYYKRDEMTTIYGYSILKKKIIHKFSSLEDCMNYYFDKLIPEYGLDGLKKHIKHEHDNGIISLCNSTYDDL